MKKIILLFLFIFISCEEKHEIKLDLKLNDSYKIAVINEIAINENDTDGFNIVNILNSITQTEYIVKKIDKNVYFLEGRLKYIKFEISTPNGSVTMNSKENRKEDIMSNLLKKMIDKPFNLRLNKSGKVEKIENLENIYSNLLDDVKGISKKQKEELQLQLKDKFNETAFKEEIEIFTNVYPSEKVAINEKWSKKSNKTLMNLKGFYENTFKLRKLQKTSAFIDGNTLMVNFKNESTAFPQYNLNGTVKLKFKINTKTGWIKEGLLDQKLKGYLEVIDNTKNNKTAKRPLTIDNRIMISGY